MTACTSFLLRPLIVAGCLLAPAAQANLLFNGSFEAVPVTASNSCDGVYPWCIRSFSSTPGWLQTGDGVDLIHNSYTQPSPVLMGASAGLQFVDMNQGGALGGLLQTVSVVPGTTYLLSLDTGAWAVNARGGTIGYQLREGSTVLAGGSFTDAVGGSWVRRTLEATATSTQMTVAIFGVAAAAAGMGLDNVSLVAVPVPEPASLPTMLAGLAALAAASRLRRQRSAR